MARTRACLSPRPHFSVANKAFIAVVRQLSDYLKKAEASH